MALGLAKERVREKVRDKVRPAATPKPHSNQHSTGKKAGPRRPGPERVTASKASKSADDISLEQAYRIRENLEKSEKQKARERKMEEDRKRAAMNRQIRKIVDDYRLNKSDADEARFFMYKERIRKVYVTSEQLEQLNSGLLGVVYLAGSYHILATAQIEAVREISPAHVPDLLSGGDEDEELWGAFEQDGEVDAAIEDSDHGDLSGDPPGDSSDNSENN